MCAVGFPADADASIASDAGSLSSVTMAVCGGPAPGTAAWRILLSAEAVTLTAVCTGRTLEAGKNELQACAVRTRLCSRGVHRLLPNVAAEQ